MRIIPLLLLAACVDHGAQPSECVPDVQLVGFPGVAGDAHQFLLGGGSTHEMCLRLDASRNREEVTLSATLATSFPLALHGANGFELAAGDGALEFTMPHEQVLFTLLSFQVPDHIATTTVHLTLDFAEHQ